MNDPLRLLDEGATNTERQLLQAGVSEEPPDRSMQRAAAALGLAAGMSAVLPGTAAASAAAKVGVTTAIKWTGLGLLVAGGVSIGAYQMASSSPSSDPGPAVQPGSAAEVGRPAVAPDPEPAAPPAEQTDEDGADERAEAQGANPVGRGRAPAVAEPVDPAASIREQTAMIDSARQQLSGGNPGGAVAEIDRYHRTFPKGVFGQEAVMIRIEALVRSGNRAAARDVARRFLAGKPSSQYTERIEALVGPMSGDRKLRKGK